MKPQFMAIDTPAVWYLKRYRPFETCHDRISTTISLQWTLTRRFAPRKRH